MNKTDELNGLINNIGDLIRKQSDQVLWDEPAIKVFVDGRRMEIESTHYKHGELIIHCDDNGAPF